MMDETFALDTVSSDNKHHSDGIEVLFFTLGDTVYGIEIKYINEII